MTVFATEKLRIHFETSERYRSTGMLGKEMGYEISTCQMQYDANNKETDKKDPGFIYSRGNGPRKCRKHQGVSSDLDGCRGALKREVFFHTFLCVLV